MNYLLLKYEIKADKKKENIEKHIAATANGIAKRLHRKYFSERRIKKIYKVNYHFPHLILLFLIEKIKIPGCRPGIISFIKAIILLHNVIQYQVLNWSQLRVKGKKMDPIQGLQL